MTVTISSSSMLQPGDVFSIADQPDEPEFQVIDPIRIMDERGPLSVTGEPMVRVPVAGAQAWIWLEQDQRVVIWERRNDRL